MADPVWPFAVIEPLEVNVSVIWFVALVQYQT